MAVMDPVNTELARKRFIQELMQSREELGLLKLDLLAAVVAADEWAESNAVAFNAAIPQPARSILTAKQKSRLLNAVVKQRYEVT